MQHIICGQNTLFSEVYAEEVNGRSQMKVNSEFNFFLSLQDCTMTQWVD